MPAGSGGSESACRLREIRDGVVRPDERRYSVNRRRECHGGEDVVGWRGDTVRGRRRRAAARALAGRGGLQPAIRADGPGPLPVLCGAPRPRTGPSQPVAQRLDVHPARRCRRDHARPPAFRQRPAPGHAVAAADGDAAGARRVHHAVPRPAGPHKAAGAGEQGLHAQGGQRAWSPRSAASWARCWTISTIPPGST